MTDSYDWSQVTGNPPPELAVYVNVINDDN